MGFRHCGGYGRYRGMRVGGHYDISRVRGSEFMCSCGYKWGYANTGVRQARDQGLDRCPACGAPAGKARSCTTRVY